MKKLILILSLIATQMHGQIEDSLSLTQFQEWIMDKEGKKVGNGLCYNLVDEFLKTINPTWRMDWSKGGKITYGEKVSRKNLRPGDIVLFEKRVDGGSSSHVGIFLGWNDDADETMLLAEQNTTGNIRTSVVVINKLEDAEAEYKKVTYYRPLLGK